VVAVAPSSAPIWRRVRPCAYKSAEVEQVRVVDCAVGAAPSLLDHVQNCVVVEVDRRVDGPRFAPVRCSSRMASKWASSIHGRVQ
jgi:hypothetical protein